MNSTATHSLEHSAKGTPPAASERTEVACLCGAVRLHIEGEPLAQFYCHCDDCQAAHSAAYVAEAIYPATAVQVTQGVPVTHAVRTTPRLGCAACGTRLFAEIEAAGGLRGVNAYLLPAGMFQPQFHMHCQYAVLPVVDNLPHYRSAPAAFGGTEERVAW